MRNTFRYFQLRQFVILGNSKFSKYIVSFILLLLKSLFWDTKNFILELRILKFLDICVLSFIVSKFIFFIYWMQTEFIREKIKLWETKQNNNLHFSFGGGGGKATKWSLCVLPLNMINQKFYSFFYFWLFFLMITSLTTLVIRIGLIGSPSLREISTKFHFDGIKFKVCFMIAIWVVHGQIHLYNFFCQLLVT